MFLDSASPLLSPDVLATAVVEPGLLGMDPVELLTDEVLPPKRLSVPRVLLVEDDFILRAHLAELLLLEGYGVSCAADGAEALRRLKSEPPPAVILTDIMLPRVDGFALRQSLLETPTLRDIPTIAVTSLRSLVDRPELGFTEVIRKPVNVDHLIELLAKLCPRA